MRLIVIPEYVLFVGPLVVLFHLGCVALFLTIALPLVILGRVRIGAFFFVGGN